MAYTKRLSEPRFLFVSVCVCFLLFLWPGLLAMYVSVCLSVCLSVSPGLQYVPGLSGASREDSHVDGFMEWVATSPAWFKARLSSNPTNY